MRWLAAVLLVLALAGCGADDRASREEYQSELRDAGAALGNALGGVDARSGDTLATLGGGVSELQAALRTAADDLDEVTPPADVEGAHDDLVEGMRGFADDLEQLNEAVEEKDLGAVREFEDEFTESESVRKIRDAAEQLQAAGYELE